MIKNYLKRIYVLSLLVNILNRWMNKIRQAIYSKPYSTKRQFILNIAEKYKQKNTFIETGTFLGDTLNYMQPHFKKLISIELSEELALKAQERFKDNEKIEILSGDSSIILKSIIDKITEPALFWLDGHYSSEFFMGNEYIKTAKGNELTPILKELQIIFNHPIQNHIILIDDFRLFTGKGEYPKFNQIKKITSNTDYKVTSVKNDIIVITPK